MIGFAADLAAIHAAEDVPLVVGTVTPRGGSAVAFTNAIIERRQSLPTGEEQERDEIDLRIPATGIAGTPARDASVSITGITGAWPVHEVDPMAPGGTVIAWRLKLVRSTTRGVLQTWAPGSSGG